MIARVIAGPCFVIAAVVASGCVTEGPPTRPPPRPVQAQPEGIRVTVVDLAATRYGRDSDKNGYADEVNAMVFLFAPPHSAPLNIPGSFSFSMFKQDGKPFATWDFDVQKSAAAAEKLLPGPGYRFQLSVLDRGTDRFESEDLQLWCVFTPADGEPIRSKNPIQVTLGRLR